VKETTGQNQLNVSWFWYTGDMSHNLLYMKIERIQGKNMEVTSAIEQYVRKRVVALEKLTKRLQPSLLSVELGRPSEHHRKGEVFYAEFQADINGEKFFANAHADDLYAAIDEVQSDVKRQITDWRKKQRALGKKEGRSFKSFLRFGR